MGGRGPQDRFSPGIRGLIKTALITCNLFCVISAQFIWTIMPISMN